MRAQLTILALGITLLTTGCKNEQKQQGAGTVGGEILPGSASDAMLPLDTVRSQAPLAPKAPAVKDGAKDAATDAASESAAPAEAGQQPATGD